MDRKIDVFLDTSVLFAAVLSDTGGSRVLLKLGEADAVTLLVSRQVLSEAEGVLKRKTPESLPLFSILLDRARIKVVPSAPEQAVKQMAEVAGHPGDAQIAADALMAKVGYLVTLDKAHLLGNRKLQVQLPFPVGSPDDFLSMFRLQ